MTKLEGRKCGARATVTLSFGLPLAFDICHSSFQPSFIKFDQIEISPDIFAAFAAGLFEKM